MRILSFLENNPFLNKQSPEPQSPTAAPLPDRTALTNSQLLGIKNARTRISNIFTPPKNAKSKETAKVDTVIAAATTNPSLGKALSAEELAAEKARIMAEVGRRLSDARGEFGKLPAEMFDEIIKHLDLDAKSKLYEVGKIKLKEEEIVHWGQDHADGFSLAQLIGGNGGNDISNLLTQQAQRRQAEQKENKDQIDAAASQLKAIQASQIKGEIDEETALTKTFSVINGLDTKVDFAEHGESTAIIAAAHAKCIRSRPNLLTMDDWLKDQSDLIGQLLMGISPRLQFHHELQIFAPDDRLLLRQSGLSMEATKLFHMLEKSDRIKRVDSLKESVARLIQVLPDLVDGYRMSTLSDAAETLAVIHNGGYANGQLADDIRSALEKLPLELMLEDDVSREHRLFPSCTAYARQCIIRELPNSKLTEDQKKQFIENILSDIKNPDFTPGGSRSEEAPYLFATVRQLTAILGKTDDQRISRQVSELALKCLTRHNERLDEETRAACIGAVKGLPLESLHDASALPGQEANVIKVLAPVWIHHMKEIKEKKDPTREELKAAIEGFNRTMQKIYNRADKKDRALLVGASLDGIRHLGEMQVRDPKLKQVQMNTLMNALSRSFTYRSKQEELPVIRASLIALNDTTRLLVLLTSGYADVLKAVDQLTGKLNSMPPGEADLSNELGSVDFAAVRSYFKEKAKHIDPQNKAAAIARVDALERVIEKLRNDQTKGDLRGS